MSFILLGNALTLLAQGEMTQSVARNFFTYLAQMKRIFVTNVVIIIDSGI